jgi:hypothetical protein
VFAILPINTSVLPVLSTVTTLQHVQHIPYPLCDLPGLLHPRLPAFPCNAQLVFSATKNLLHDGGIAPQTPPQHRSQQQHLADHGVLKLLRTALSNPWLLALCFCGILLASASNTYVFFLPMIINALLQGKCDRKSCSLVFAYVPAGGF